MKLKINKACDLSSISVLPPQTRRTSVVSSGLESSSIFPRSQAASQLRPQQPQQSQLTLSQGVSSQHGLFSQFSQNSQDEILTNEKIGSQERENSARRSSCLPPMSYTREESQMVVSRTSNNLARKWPSQEYKCQVGEELEHRIGMIETSLSRFGMILDSVQSDIMQVHKATKEVALETEGVRQKLTVHDDSLQSMSKGQEDIKTCLDMGLNSLSDQLKQIVNQENSGEIISMLSTLSEKIDTKMVKLQDDLRKDFCKEIQAISCSIMIPKQKQATPPMHGPKAVSYHAPPQEVHFRTDAPRHLIAQQTSLLPKVKMGGWTSVKQEGAAPKVGNLSKRSNQIKTSPNQLVECRVVIESDEEFDGCFSCLLKEKETEKDDYSIKEVSEEAARILRKARRRKRKHCDTIIIN
ncbi:putative recombination initiation defects 3 [Sesamum alatum]|uniref:Recombination initiation defects 3 n=1 Tax=Sesamum alatum TaxID=300844 RepID=A0AAE2CE00_9LAMI|nr:putative recombination initiation defects 3 [Sesamum alatum]